jgi:hypothetical protein
MGIENERNAHQHCFHASKLKNDNSIWFPILKDSVLFFLILSYLISLGWADVWLGAWYLLYCVVVIAGFLILDFFAKAHSLALDLIYTHAIFPSPGGDMPSMYSCRHPSGRSVSSPAATITSFPPLAV